MTDANAKFSDTSEQSSATASSFSIPAFFATMVNVRGFYGNYVRAILGMTARQLQNQADYLEKLSAVSRPTEAFECHAEYMRNFLTGCTKEGQRFVEEGLRQVKENVSHSSSPTAH